MARRELGIAFGVGTLTGALLWGMAACSVGHSGEAPVAEMGDGAATTDGTIESSTVDHFVRNDVANDRTPPPDAPSADAHEAGPPCAGVICNGKCTDATDCSSCTGAPLLCASQGTCLSACAKCADEQSNPLPIECYACDSNHQNPVGTCEPADSGSYCLSGDYFASGGANVYHCGCDGDAGSCPGASQICVPLGVGSFCVTCGEPVQGDAASGAVCKGGGTCSPDTHSCAP
jgi:hypothetical protein